MRKKWWILKQIYFQMKLIRFWKKSPVHQYYFNDPRIQDCKDEIRVLLARLFNL